MLVFAVEGGNGSHDILQLFVRQLGINGKREDLFRGTFGMGECPFLISQIAIAVLEVQRQG